MIEQILDLHIHSKYARACSKDLELSKIAAACAVRGITMVATGDFTHPRWFEHMRECLTEDGEGIYRLAGETSEPHVRFIIGTEVASIKKHKDAVRRVHHLIFAPSLEVAEKFNKKLEAMGMNLKADGRPILGLTSKQLLEVVLEIDERMVMIPAHAWTPWFGIFGSKGGYDTLEDAFEELTPHIRAIETGLSSDPLMNARLSRLDNITLISNSDAHSAAKLGREANVLAFDSESDITYAKTMRIIQEGDPQNFLYTIEFYPEEGKYHLDGHRECNIVLPPEETKKYGGICPVCRKPLTIGVMNRVLALADRTEDEAKSARKISYKSLVPLPEIIGDTVETGINSLTVQRQYASLIKTIGNEFHILLQASLEEIEKASTKQIALAIGRVRKGSIYIKPGYDGVFGVVKVFGDTEDRRKSKQMGLELE